VHLPAALARLLYAAETPQRALRLLLSTPLPRGAACGSRRPAARRGSGKAGAGSRGTARPSRRGSPSPASGVAPARCRCTRAASALPRHAAPPDSPPVAGCCRAAPRWRTRASQNTSWTTCATLIRSWRPLRFVGLSACESARRAATCPRLSGRAVRVAHLTRACRAAAARRRIQPLSSHDTDDLFPGVVARGMGKPAMISAAVAKLTRCVCVHRGREAVR
jgi:hypothetical protein